MLSSLRNAALDALGPTRLIRRGPGTARRVALTFDDGPQPLTGAYLETLDRLGVPATFFLMGDLTAPHPEVVRDYQRRGHQVASHGWDHTAFPRLGPRALRDQLRRTDAVLGPQPAGRAWVRPPYGAISARVLAQLVTAGYTVALWSFDSFDHEVRDVDGLVARCDPDAIAPGEVLLFHEGQPWTLAALPAIVGRLRDAGYECVTMFDLFAA
jgi:peptidoglycan/xylan/chitin deacetylase (PgdA/CDA1 family)